MSPRREHAGSRLNQETTAAVADETQLAVEDGRKVLVLTERIDDLDRIRRSLEEHTLGALAELLRPNHTPIEDLLAKHLPSMTENRRPGGARSRQDAVSKVWTNGKPYHGSCTTFHRRVLAAVGKH